MCGKNTELCNSTGEPQDGPPKEWRMAQALHRKKDSWKFTKIVAAKWGLGEEQFEEAWKITWESIQVNNIIKRFKWRLLNKVLPATSDRLSRQGPHRAPPPPGGGGGALWDKQKLSGADVLFSLQRKKAAHTFWIVLANKCMPQTGTAPAITI